MSDCGMQFEESHNYRRTGAEVKARKVSKWQKKKKIKSQTTKQKRCGNKMQY